MMSQNLSPLLGTVLAIQANYYWVKLDINENQLLCTRRTKLKKIGQQVMVGDRVLVEEPDWLGNRGAIAQVFPRQTQLDRPPIANANQILLLFALADPPLDTYQLTRFLLKGESTKLNIILALNKSDLVSQSEQLEWKTRLNRWGYDPIFISVNQGLSDDSGLIKSLYNNMTILTGPSGVGKSSLINCLIPYSNQRVAEVSGKLSKGRHTTRHVELFQLPFGGLLADSPGFNQPDLTIIPSDLIHYFPEGRSRIKDDQGCQFSDCLHRDEPNCVVRGDWERYCFYLELLGESILFHHKVEQQSNNDSGLKVKCKKSGENQLEPKLEAKIYRRLSRKTNNQILKAHYQEDLDYEEDS